MYKLLIFVIALCWLGSARGQSTFVLELSCRDKSTQERVQNASVTVRQGDSTWRSRTGQQGKAWFHLPLTMDFSVSAEHGFYNPGSLAVKLPRMSNGDTLRKLIDLSKARVRVLDEHTVLAPGAVEVVFQSEQLSVSDFEMLPNGEILLLAYPKRLDKGSELLVYDGKNVLQSFKLKENPIELIHDFRGNPHVVCEKGVYGIHRDLSSIGISNLEKSYYMKYVFPIVDTIRSRMYFSNFNPDYPAFDYFAFDRLDSSYRKIMEIKDDLMMELYRAEYKWADVRVKLWAANKELETGIDREIWVGANYFTNTIYYKQLYAPMFRRNDSIFVFDYYKDKLFTFDDRGNKLDSVPIFHHYQPKQTGWKRTLLQDDVSGDIYVFFEKAGICSVRRIDLKTGALGSQIRFDHKYVDKLAISGHRAYYIYRPYESAQKKYLYMTQLP